MVQGYCIEETIEWAINYAELSNQIGVSMSRRDGRIPGKGTIGKKATTPDPNLFCCAHFHVL
jgi:hypothetical protein